jgi:hypothetical protein
MVMAPGDVGKTSEKAVLDSVTAVEFVFFRVKVRVLVPELETGLGKKLLVMVGLAATTVRIAVSGFGFPAVCVWAVRTPEAIL